MAKGKTSSGRHYTSKGEVGVNKKLSNAVRRDRSEVDIALAKINAHRKGKKVWLTIDNPNPLETNKRKIRVLARTVYGDPKDWNKFKFQLK